MEMTLKPPQQARSQETLAAILSASEALLEARPFDEISVQEITQAAGSSTGSFYARFRGKEDLLPHLYSRFDDRLADRISALDAGRDWASMPLADIIDLCITEHIRAYAERPHLMREFTLYVRRAGAAGPPGGTARRSRLFAGAVGRLTAARTTDGRPVRPEAATFILSVIGMVVREAVLFGDLPLARAGAVSHSTLRRELGELAMAYLAAGNATDRA